MSYRVFVERAASKSLAELPLRIQKQLAERLLSLEGNPYRQSRKLEGREGYRVRAGDYRILYSIDEATKTVSVWRIGHRRDIYR